MREEYELYKKQYKADTLIYVKLWIGLGICVLCFAGYLQFNYSSSQKQAETLRTKADSISNVLDKVRQEKTLNYYSKNISQGVIPGNDKIYYFEIIEENNVCYKIKNLNNEVDEIEKGLVRKIIKGNNVSRYLFPDNDYYIIYPYQIQDGKQYVLNENEFITNFPKTYKYLSRQMIF